MEIQDAHLRGRMVLAAAILAVAHGNRDGTIWCLDLSQKEQLPQLRKLCLPDGGITVQTALDGIDQGWHDTVRALPEQGSSREPMAVFRQCPVLVLTSKDISPSDLMRGIEQGLGAEYAASAPYLQLCVDDQDAVLQRHGDLPEILTTRFTHVLAQLADGARELRDISVLSQPEWERLVVDSYDTSRHVSVERGIADLFREQATQNPDRKAVHFNGFKQTYGDLLRRAEQVAEALHRGGLKPGEAVGIFADRSSAAIEAIVGTVLAGGVYVPLSPDWPESRLSHLADRCGIRTVLVSDVDFPCAGYSQIQVLELASDAPRLKRFSDRQGDDRLYVLFTSGSTGEPKGVEIPHRGVVRLVHDRDLFPIEAGQGVMHAAPLGFDASTMEIWLPLLNGGYVAGFAKDEVLQADTFRKARAERPFDFAFFTVTLFEALLDQSPDVVADIGHVLIGGEAIRSQTAAKALATPGFGRLINGYGPTETTVFAVTMPITTNDLTGDIVAIGKPIANTSAYILDRHMRPVPTGIPGELCLGGDGVALGYLEDAERTAESFVSNPFGPGILYRTGDQVIRRDDGIIDFIGRFDGQVKIRGHRIEPGEIEKTLESLEGVDRAVIRVHEPVQGDRRLAAWVKFNDPEPDEAAAVVRLEDSLRQLLPDYMIPSWILPIPDFPMTANGKTDFARLPLPTEIDVRDTASAIDPDDPIPGLLPLFRQALFNPDFGAEDSFLASGGDSLLAVRLVQKIRNSIDITLPISLFFEARTAAAVADYLRLVAWRRQEQVAAADETVSAQVMRF